MSVVSWGYGRSGALGSGAQKDALLPTVVGGQLQGKRVIGVACGEEHSLAVDDLGSVYAWGRNKEGQCGQENPSPLLLTPHRVDFLLHERVVKVAAGSHQSFAITDDGKLYRWGLFHQRALNATPQYFGLSGMRDISQEAREMIDRSHFRYFSNKEEEGPEDHVGDVESVAAFRKRAVPVPELVDLGGKKVRSVTAGYCFYLIVTEDGALYSFGFNDKGQLGLGHRFSQEAPQLVAAFEGVEVERAVAGQQHSVVLTRAGQVYSWGGGVFGLGHGDGEDLLEPHLIELLANKRVTQVASGIHHTFCITEEGEIYSFGHGEYGQQGTGDLGERGEQTRNALLPRRMERVPWTEPVRAIECGHLHTIFILEDGSVYTCGWGTCGVLGHGDTKYRLIPTNIKALEGDAIIAAAAGWKHNIAIKQASSTFAFDFEKMLSSPKGTDVTFLVEKKPIKAHQAVVCFRCPRIRAMVAFDQKLTRTGHSPEFVVKGARFVAFKAMVHYLYTDHLVVAPFFAPDVASLALRFGLPRLEALARQLFSRTKEKICIPPSSFADEMSELIDHAKYSDITFRFPDPSPRVVYGHRRLLAARCSYFQTMFEGPHGFKDSSSTELSMEMSPVSLEIFLLTLQFIYTGDRSVVTPDVALGLLASADYFMLDDLKRICEDVIEKTLLIQAAEHRKEGRQQVREEEEGGEEEEEQPLDEMLQEIQTEAKMFGAKRLAHFCQETLRKLGAAAQ